MPQLDKTDRVVVVSADEYDSLQDEVNQARLEKQTFLSAVSDMEEEGLDTSMFRNGILKYNFE